MAGSGVISIRTNAAADLFTTAAQDGCHVYHLEPLAEVASIPASKVGSLLFAEPLDRTNLIALVSGGQQPRLPQNTALLWDSRQDAAALRYTFSEPVTGCVMSRDHIAYVTRSDVYVFTLASTARQIFRSSTADNPHGLVQIVDNRLVFPGIKEGSVQFVELRQLGSGLAKPSPVTLIAHKSSIAALALSPDGRLVATASRKGTIIRLWDVERRAQLLELRRGADETHIHSLVFSADSEWLTAVSDRGSVHLFATKRRGLNRKSVVGEELRPAATCTLTPAVRRTAFFNNCSLAVLAVDGGCHRLVFSDESIYRDSYDNFLQLHDEW